MRNKSNVFNLLIIIVTIVVGILIANKIYYSTTHKKSETVTYIHVENNITPFVFNKIVNPISSNTENSLEDIKETTDVTKKDNTQETLKKPVEEKKEESTTPEIVTNIVFDGLTMEQLVIKLNNNMKNELANMGQLYAEYSLSLGIDPYVALAITLQETGCSRGGCDSKVIDCNNVGGQKGSPTCNGSSYKKYESLEEGIKGYLNNLSKNYYQQGLTTPELMNTKYASDPNWSNQINNFVNVIKSS